MKKKTKAFLSFGGVIFAITFIWIVFHGLVFAYCSDAYIRTDIAEISPRIDGHLLRVNIVNNQFVKKDQELLKIDPYPYQLTLNIQRAALKQEIAQLAIYRSKLEIAKSEEKLIKIRYDMAHRNLKRYQTLMTENATTQEIVENMTSVNATQHAAWLSASENVRFYEQSVQAQIATIESTKAKIALAEYDLTQTSIIAGHDGYISNINCRPGDFVKAGQNLFGLISANDWWVEASYKEYLLKRIKKGAKVWILPDLNLSRFITGEVISVSRGTMRETDTRGVLPVVSPTTDWVRLSQRFQVRIKFKEELPDDMLFFMGSDVRTFVWVW